jgi:hypothetical protein
MQFLPNLLNNGAVAKRLYVTLITLQEVSAHCMQCRSCFAMQTETKI